MTNAIVATEEVLASIREGAETVGELSTSLYVSEATARRHAMLLVERGWVVRLPAVGRGHHFYVTQAGSNALRDNTEF